jgi:hypothetical protein
MFLADPSTVDLSFVRNAPHVKHLRIGGVERPDIAPITALHELETLDVTGLCDIDAQQLAQLPKLRWMTISMPVTETQKLVRPGLTITPYPNALCNTSRP